MRDIYRFVEKARFQCVYFVTDYVFYCVYTNIFQRGFYQTSALEKKSVKSSWSPEVGKLWPEGQMRSTKPFHLQNMIEPNRSWLKSLNANAFSDRESNTNLLPFFFLLYLCDYSVFKNWLYLKRHKPKLIKTLCGPCIYPNLLSLRFNESD